MNDRPLISVIMAAYNAELTIQDAIDSALAQTYRELEIIVVDDCSTDRTPEIVAGYADERVRLVRNKENSGAAYSRFQGVMASRGTMIAILDSDDMWTPDKIERQIALMQSCNADILYTGVQFINKDGEDLHHEFHVPVSATYRELLKQNCISNSSSLVKKEILENHMSLEDNIHEDYLCWLRALKNGAVAIGIDEPMLIYRISAGSKSGNKLESARMNWRTLRKAGLSIISAAYYMSWYTYNGLKKFRGL